jgi:hypothetical protein
VVNVWNATTGQVVHTFRDHQNVVRSVAFSSDGSQLASGSGDLSVRIRNPITGERIRVLKGAYCWVHSVTFRPEGSGEPAPAGQGGLRPAPCLALGSGDGSVQLWDILTDQPNHDIPAHGNFVLGVAFSPDGTRLASVSADELIKLWDVATGQEVLSLHGHTGGVNGVAFSPDGSRFAAAGGDGTVKIWEAQPVTREGAIEREARGLLEFLFARPLCRADVLDYLRTSPTIRPEVRQRALVLAEHPREETDPARFQQAAWAVVRQRHLNAFQYRFALRQAETAQHGTTLGIARYRTGRLEEALATLPPQSSLPADLAFRAMAEYRLGRQEPARATLERLRETLKKPEWAEQADAQAFAREAEDLLHPAAGDLQQVRP